MLIVAFAGLLAAWWSRRELAVPVTLAFVPFWYLVASWCDWSFSAAFGDRAFDDVMPFLAIPLAFAFASLRGRLARVLAGGASAVFVVVTCVLMVSYWLDRLPGGGIGPAGYFRLLLLRG